MSSPPEKGRSCTHDMLSFLLCLRLRAATFEKGGAKPAAGASRGGDTPSFFSVRALFLELVFCLIYLYTIYGSIFSISILLRTYTTRTPHSTRSPHTHFKHQKDYEDRHIQTHLLDAPLLHRHRHSRHIPFRSGGQPRIQPNPYTRQTLYTTHRRRVTHSECFHSAYSK